jgi:hypothetical protein
LVLSGLFGCAGPTQIQEAAYRQDQKALQLEAEGDYVGAAKAREAAAKQRQKAADRSVTYF